MLHVFHLLLCTALASALSGYVPADYNNGNGILIDNDFFSLVASFAVKELRSEGRLIGVITELTTGACRSCHRHVFEGDRLHLLIDVFEKVAPSDSSPLQHCSVVLTLKPLNPNFELDYIECFNESVSRPAVSVSDGDYDSKSDHVGGWNVADTNSDDVVSAAMFATVQWNSMSNAIRRFALHSVLKATTQIVSGVNYELDFIVRSTPCGNTLLDVNKAIFECDLLTQSTPSTSDTESNSVEFQYCSALVWDQPWQDPQYTLTQLTCEPAGMAVEQQQQQASSVWFDSTNSQFKLGQSEWSFEANSASRSRPSEFKPAWFALFTLSGTPTYLALQFRTFASRFNRTYLSSNASEINFRYYRFSQNAARMNVARLAETGTATYKLVTNPFADASLHDFCVALSNFDSTSQQMSNDESVETAATLPLATEQLAILQFYQSKIVQTWPPMFNSAVFRLVGDAQADPDCAYVTAYVKMLGSTSCRAVVPERPCTLSYQLVELGARSLSLASSAQRSIRLSTNDFVLRHS